MKIISRSHAVGFSLLSLAATQTRIAGDYLRTAYECPWATERDLKEWRRLKREARQAIEWSRQYPGPVLP